MNKKCILPVFVLLIFVPVVWNLFRPGFFISDDGEWMIIRFSAFYRELRDGQLPVRYLQFLNFGYGYPVATFLYPGFMYAASIFKALGLGLVDSIKAVMFFSILGGSFGMYYWLSHYFSKTAALAGLTAYVYNPYFLFDIYKRGSVGEILAMGIVPLLLLSIVKKKFRFAAFLFGILVISHNILFILYLPVIIIYTVLHEQKVTGYKKVRNALFLSIFAAGLSAFFWIPIFFELSLTVFPTIAVSDYSAYFITFDNITLLSLIGFLALCYACVLIVKRKTFPVLLLFVSVSSVSILLSTPLTGLLWKVLPLNSLVQFPFRFLSLTLISGSFLTAYLFHSAGAIQIKVLTGVLLVSILLALPYLETQGFIHKGDSFYESNDATTTVKDEYMPVWVSTKPIARPNEEYEWTGESSLKINKIYWPGYEIFINGSKQKISYQNAGGIIEVEKPANDYGNVTVKFKETPYRLMADAISVVSLAALFLYGKKIFV